MYSHADGIRADELYIKLDRQVMATSTNSVCFGLEYWTPALR